MPTFETANVSKRPNASIESDGYTELLAIFNRSDTDTSVIGRASRAKVTLKTAQNYEATVSRLGADLYPTLAGTELSNIFMPFETKRGPLHMPAFHPEISGAKAASGERYTGYDLLPFHWDENKSTVICNRTILASGDSLNSLISSEQYYGDINLLRDNSYIRSIGLRLPAMAVGWGYTLEGKPWPSGSSDSVFKGEVVDGWQVDPINYIAAPIDLKYDTKRHLWVSGAEGGFWAKIEGYVIPSGNFGPSGTMTGSGIAYKWTEQTLSDDGSLTTPDNPRKGGDNNKDIAYETNGNTGVVQGTKVWMHEKEHGIYMFDCCLTKESFCDRWFFDKEGHQWTNDGTLWQEGEFYSKDQSVIGLDGKQYKALDDNFSTVDIAPSGNNGISTWQTTDSLNKGVKIKLNVLGRTNNTDGCFDEYEAYFYFDSHGHLSAVKEEDTCDPVLPDCQGEYQGMVNQMVTQNEKGYDWLRAHATI